MSNATHDQNRVKAKLGVWCVDGITTIPIAINPLTGGVKTDSVSTISYTPVNISPRDANFQSVWLGESSTGSGLVLPINVNANGAILIAL